jgi:hypothetical protein
MEEDMQPQHALPLELMNFRLVFDIFDRDKPVRRDGPVPTRIPEKRHV